MHLEQYTTFQSDYKSDVMALVDAFERYCFEKCNDEKLPSMQRVKTPVIGPRLPGLKAQLFFIVFT